MKALHILAWFFVCIVECCLAIPTKKPLCRCEKYKFDGKPFVVMWNSPTIGCDFNFSTPIDLKKFGIYENDHQTWDGKRVTVFSSAQLGLYPYYTENGFNVYNGGLPQLIDLNEHLRKARMDILTKIPDPNYNGLAVIDWEPWRPLWETNWNKKRIYKVKSVENVRQRYPSWPLERLIEQAKTEFERSGRAMFQQTIDLGKELRPNAKWGFYGFPDCYGNKGLRYQCSDKVKKQSDKLDWLYESSTALFPSMYLLEEHPANRDYVLGRLRETLRFVEKGVGKTRTNIPVFVYHRNIYERDPFAFNFLSKKDLSNTIGVAADLGAAGVVIWGNRFDENTSPHVCQMISEYVHDTLGPYVQQKMRDVDKCSAKHCGHEGHCIDRSLLSPDVVKYYEDQEKLSFCLKPAKTKQQNYKRDSVAHPHNYTTYNQTMYSGYSDYLPTDISKERGELGDIGASTIARKRVNDTIMDDFFRQLNGTSSTTHLNDTMTANSKNFTSYNDINNNNNNNNNRTNSITNATEPQKMFPTGSNITQQRNISQKAATYANQTANFTTLTGSNPNKTLGANVSTSTSANNNRSNGVSNHTEFRLGRNMISRGNNVKKSSIPHPPSVRNPSLKQHHHPVAANQKKSDITQQLLSGMSGSVIRIADLFRTEKPKKRNNITTQNAVETNKTKTSVQTKEKHSNSSRKSEIYQTSGGHLPLMSSRRNHHSWLPHIYVILIGVSLGGALLFSLIFIGAYYYVSLKNTFPSHRSDVSSSQMFHDESNVKSPPNLHPPQAHSSPKGAQTSAIVKRQSKLTESGSLQSIDLKRNVNTELLNVCESKSDQGRKYNISSYRRAKSISDLDRKNEKLDKLDRKRLRNTSSTRSLKRNEDEGSEIEININDLVK